MQNTKITSFFHRFRRQLLSHIIFARILFIGLAVIFIWLGWIIFHEPTLAIITGLQTAAGKPLPQSNGRTNILILGSGGSGHEGPDLSDTMILASLKSDPPSITFLSIPRDIWVPSLQAKINTAYHYGYLKDATSGGLLNAKAAVHEITGQPIQFAINVDFSTFAKAIDLLGGVDVNVEHAFTDTQYPITGRENDQCDGDPEYKCRYETIQFNAGPQHLDGTTALKFVRSRHSTDLTEGTDFARSKRQEKVIDAFRTRLVSIKNLINTKIYKDLFSLISQSVITDITPEYYATFIQLGLKIYHEPLKSFNLSAPDQLYNPPLSEKYQGQWVLIPKDNNPQTVFDYISTLLK